MRYETYETQKLNVMRHCCVIVLVNVFAPAPFVASSLRSVVLTFVARSLHKADPRRCLMAFFVITSLPVHPSVYALPRQARLPFRSSIRDTALPEWRDATEEENKGTY